MMQPIRFSYLLFFWVGVPIVAKATQKIASNRPNVIYIYADDMGKGMLSVYGQKHFTTPNIDALVNNGTSFDNAYGCMLSAPARASLLTGYHDCRKDKWSFSQGGRFIPTTNNLLTIPAVEQQIDQKDVLLEEGDYYLPQVFKKAGYVTAEIGKLEWGFTATRKQMKEHGWDYYYGYLDHVRCHGFYPPFLFENGTIVPVEGNTLPNCGKSIEQETERTYTQRWDMEGKRVYSQDLFLEKIIAFIRENKDRPFFLFHPTQLPHGPVSVPAIHPEVAENKQLTPIEKEYASMVKILDDHVGIIMQELRSQGLDKNTIVVFSSDNGHEIYYSQAGRCEKPYRNLVTRKRFDDFTDKYYSNLSGDIFDGNAGMAGLKRSNLNGGVCIPLVFHGQGIPSGVKSLQVVSNYDFIATIANMLAVNLPVKKDGISFLSTLTKGRSLPKTRYVVFGSNVGPGIVMNDGWKLRHYYPKDIFELYNLNNDPQERYNVINRYPQKAEELKKLLLEECNGDLSNGINRVG